MATVHIRRVGIVGAGQVGAGIARLLADLGATVVVVAPRPGGVGRAAERLRLAYQSDLDRGRISAAEARTSLGRIRVTPDYSELARTEWVIESVIEDLNAKQHVLAAVEECVSAECVIASNTSSLPITSLAATARRPDRVIGTHYFWPAHRYRLVEIAAGEATSELTLQRTLAITCWQGKVPLVVRDRPGFFTTRILLAYLNEAIALVTEGASIGSVDQAMKVFGWAMGPFRLLDAVGLEIFRGIYGAVAQHLGDRVAYIRRLSQLVDGGLVGHPCSPREGTKRFYLGPDSAVVDPQVYSLIGRKANTSPTWMEVSTRPVWQMINEIGHCLDEAIVSSPGDADLGALLGLGWPRAHGGPLEYARSAGVETIVRQLAAWARHHGPRFTPSRFLTQCASVGARTASLAVKRQRHIKNGRIRLAAAEQRVPLRADADDHT